jgi:hypothetical protein
MAGLSTWGFPGVKWFTVQDFKRQPADSESYLLLNLALHLKLLANLSHPAPQCCIKGNYHAIASSEEILQKVVVSSPVVTRDVPQRGLKGASLFVQNFYPDLHAPQR